MKTVAVMKRSHGAHPRHGALLHLEKGMEKPKKDYEKHLGRVLCQTQQTMSQNLWALDLLNRQNIGSDGFGLIAAEAARLSHRRRRNAITSEEICSAVRGLYPARRREHPVRDGPCSDCVDDQS
ncbi:histone H2B-like isoform X4 [Mixophyes fleayi]